MQTKSQQIELDMVERNVSLILRLSFEIGLILFDLHRITTE